MILLLQYYLGESGYTTVPGGADATNVLVCGVNPHTDSGLALRAVTNYGSGERFWNGTLSTLTAGEFYFLNWILPISHVTWFYKAASVDTMAKYENISNSINR